jgi:hypothetical protein
MIDPINKGTDVGMVAASRGPAAGRARAVESSEAAGVIPATPPPEVLDALDTAAQVLQDLKSKQLNLSFSVEGEGAMKEIHVEVRDGTGALVREIPTQHLLDLLAGDTHGVAVDERG